MFIIECLPFSKGLNKESLSYFGPKYLEPGSLIKINLRGKSISALVIGSRSVSEAKSEIKAADFQLKKILNVTGRPFLDKEFLEAVKETSEYFAATTGALLSHLIPTAILEGDLPLPKVSPVKKAAQESGTKKEVSIIQAPDEERLDLYKSLIREEFAKKRSVFMCLPQNEDVRQAKEKLERGIEVFVCAFHNEMDKKELLREWKRVSSTDHPVLVIATASWLFLPRSDFGTIIIDKENENGWKTLSRPFADRRFFAAALAKQKGIRAVIGDCFLRTETLYKYKQGEIGEFESVKWRVPLTVETKVADLRDAAKKEFKAVSPPLESLIKETADRGSHLFIFAVRKGVSSVTVCRDCGEQVKCNNCSAPMVLYRTNSGGAFRCHQCGETRDAAEVCSHCGSWKLASFGAGIDRVAEEIRAAFPQINLFELHKDAAPSAAKATKIVADFYASRGSVLLGTEMAFSFLYKKVAATAIASFDSLFSIPDFRIREKIFRLILQTKNISKENFLIQTRNPSDPTVEFAVSGNLLEFYKKEIEDRASLNYPPFGLFIKVTVRGPKTFVVRETENLKNILSEYRPAIFNSINEKKGEQLAANAVIKLSPLDWPHSPIFDLLKSIPPHFEIKVDPDNLL